MDPDNTNPQPPSVTDEPRAEPSVQDRSDDRPGSPAPGDNPERNYPTGQEQQDRPRGRQQGGNSQRNQQGSPADGDTRRNGRRGPNPRHGRRGRGHGPRRDRQPQQQQQQQQQQQDQQPSAPIVADAEVTGWFDPQRDSGFIRRAANSYLPDPSDPSVPGHIVRQLGLRRGDEINATTGPDHRNRTVVVEVRTINDAEPATVARRPDFGSLTASYPDRKLKLETGKPAKGGPELTRRAIDLIAPIGYGQRALIVAPARAGKTMLLQAITEGVAVNHPQAVLLVLLVDERPEEVSEMITWGYGEVVASSFDMPANRHTDVAEITLERARRLVELGRDVVIVLDSITRLARAHNTVERGTGRTLSGGLDATAMAKPKAFFGSARAVAEQHGGGSLTIIATALVETGSRMDDVIFEEFKGTGNCEIKLDRTLAEKRIFPAIDIGTSGTRREEKLFRPEQLDHVYTLRRGLQQMPSTSAMEWLIKRIASTPSNDALLEGL
ncbi:MAG: transcription termination factor Rho [Gemmatimonadaceae bacterium]|nr:transcription termination factor Rho [Gemmatimonadaceae bacterium]